MRYRKYPPDTWDRWVIIIGLVIVLVLILTAVHYR